MFIYRHNFDISRRHYFGRTVLWIVFICAAAACAALPAHASTFTNSTQITIVDNAPASVYPSNINVSGLGGTVTSVKVTINGFSHTFPADVGLLLVGPTGAALLIQDDVGAGGNASVSNVTYTLADGFPALPELTAWQAGSYKPTAYISTDSFGAPAPGSYANPGPDLDGTATFASVFGGTDPNGTWKLYVEDFQDGDFGSISGGWMLEITTNGAPPATHPPFDFDGDGKTDASIFRPSDGTWWYVKSSTGTVPAFQFGQGTDKIAAADFTGDGKTDVAFFRPSTGQWFVLRSEDENFFAFPFGTNGDIPMPADYDGDGKADAAVFRPSTGTWFILRSSDGQVSFVQLGGQGDQPIAADYDGDGKADPAIFRPNGANPGASEFWVQRSRDGLLAFQFGTPTDKAVPGDYTGDGKADIAFFRPSTGFWFVLRSEDFNFFAFPFGTAGDIPVPGDYDGDGKFDPAVFRPSASTWFMNRSTAGVQIVNFGLPTDQPVPNAYVR